MTGEPFFTRAYDFIDERIPMGTVIFYLLVIMVAVGIVAIFKGTPQ